MDPNDRPDAPIIGANGNIFNILGVAQKALRRSGFKEEAAELQDRVFKSGSYTEALSIIQEYVNPVSQEDMEQHMEMWF